MKRLLFLIGVVVLCPFTIHSQAPKLEPITCEIRRQVVDPRTGQEFRIDTRLKSSFERVESKRLYRYTYSIQNHGSRAFRYQWHALEKSRFRQIAVEKIASKELEVGGEIILEADSPVFPTIPDDGLSIYTTGEGGQYVARGWAPAYVPR